jgi:UDP-N-acetylglucosamine 3-dehydrogenase
MKLGFGVVGLGVGASHANCVLNNPRAKLIGICDVDSATFNHKKLKYAEIPLKTTNFNEIINCNEIDVVLIATPDHVHMTQAIQALEREKHVFCEKPLALTLHDCKEIVEASKQSQKTFFVGQVCRYAPGFMKAKEIFDEGLIGDLFFVESEYAHDYSYMPKDHWRFSPEIMRYPFIGGACHAVDLLRWFAGDPIEVSAYGNQKCFTDWPPVMDATIAIYKFPNNVIGKAFCSVGCKRPYTMRTVLYGTQGTIECDNRNACIKVFSTKWLPTGYGTNNSGFWEIPVDVASHNFTKELDDFIDIILSGRENKLDALEGSKTVSVCVATVESAKQEKAVKIEYLS